MRAGIYRRANRTRTAEEASTLAESRNRDCAGKGRGEGWRRSKLVGRRRYDAMQSSGPEVVVVVVVVVAQEGELCPQTGGFVVVQQQPVHDQHEGDLRATMRSTSLQLRYRIS